MKEIQYTIGEERRNEMAALGLTENTFDLEFADLHHLPCSWCWVQIQ